MSTETEDSGELELSRNDRNSPLWLRIEGYLNARIELHRRRNDADLAPDQTARLRGQIAELKNLLAAGESQD
jgi:hypothetical protein